MSRWGSAFRLIAAAVVSQFVGWQVFAAVAETERQRRLRDKANNRARAAYNDAQKDRLQMLDLQPDSPRTLVLGRVRYVEGVRDRWTSGTNSEKLTQIVSFAGHEVDAFEGWYVDDTPVTLDGSGWVQEAPWKVTANEPANDGGTLDGSGGAVITLSFTPVGGSATAVWFTGSGDSSENGTASVSVVGTTATVTGGRAGATFAVNYTRAVATTYLRIRTYSGTAAQNVGSAIVGEYPGKITSTDKFAGIAVAVLDMVYSPDVFPQGPPNVTAVLRGAKCYDPRLDSTVAGGSGAHRIGDPTTWAWTENPALHALRYAMWSSGFGLVSGRGITAKTLADVMAAANQCDISTSFTLRMPDTSTTSVTLPRHRCGITISADADPKTAMDAIVDTMAGEWAFDGPELRLRAGVKASSVASIDQTWLVESYDPGGEDGEQDPVITATQSISREQRWNRVVGKCVDPAQRYQMLPFPAVSDTTLIAAKGEKRGDLDLPGVNHVAHAQHLASIEIRRRQAGALQVMQCDPRAELLQLFDIVTETIPDYGISAKPFEVVGVDISLTDAPVRLMLREISDAIFTVDAELKGVDPAPDSGLRSPWEVAQLGTLTVTSGTTALLDNSVVARAQVTWAAITGEWIRNGGEIEIQYTRADLTLPTGDWASWTEQGNSTQATIPGLQAGRPYLFRGRLVQKLPLVRGAWSTSTLHVMSNVVTNTGALGGRNLLANSSLDDDSDANNIPDGWTVFSNGTTGTVGQSISTGGVGFGGTKFMQVNGSNLGTASTDQIGITQTVELAGLAGNPMMFTAWAQGGATGLPDLILQANYFSGAGGTGSLVAFNSTTHTSPDASWRRYQHATRVPTGALSVKLYALMAARKTSAGSTALNLDALQLELGSVATAYAPRANELLTGTVQTVNLAPNSATVTDFKSGGSGSWVSNATGDAVVIGTTATGGSGVGAAVSFTNSTGGAVVVQIDATVFELNDAGTGGTPSAFFRYQINGGSFITKSLYGTAGGANPGLGIGFLQIPLTSTESLTNLQLMGVTTALKTAQFNAWSLRLTAILR